jgi:8-oxo-dGTP diphosphatase
MIVTLKHIHVTCAIIERDGLVLAAQRNALSSMPLKWEFPGGKIERGETAEECLRRELVEEFGVQTRIQRSLPASTYAYPAFTITLYPFVCAIESGDLMLREHAAVTWLPPHQLFSLDWAEADVPVLKSYIAEQKTTQKRI